MAASLAAHLAVLAVLALHAPRMRIPASEPGPPEAIIPILIMPRAPPPSAGPGSKPAPIRLHRRPQRFALEPLPLKPLVAPTEETARPAASQGPKVLSLPRPEDAVATNARRALRGRLGCANADALGLTRAEREACEDRLAAGARTADFPGLGIEADKASGLAAAAARRERDYIYKRGGTPPGVTRGNSAEDIGAMVGSDKPTLKIPF